MTAAVHDPARIINHMRRSPAIILFLALLAPILLAFSGTGADAASLPACCRKGGMHHCMQAFVASESPALVSPPCPLYPTPPAVPAVTRLAFTCPPAIAFGLPVSLVFPLAAHEAACRPAARIASLRGPPSLGA